MFFSSQIILCLTLTKPEDVSLCKEEANLWWDELLYVKKQYPKGSRYIRVPGILVRIFTCI